jgi:DNA repair protein RecO
MQSHSTHAIILKKIFYSESSLIINCLSPELGRVDFIARGARRIGKNKMPELDLFREISVSFRESQTSGLHSISKPELIESNYAVSDFPSNFLMAVNVSAFIISNLHFHIHSQRLYTALRKMLKKFSEQKCGKKWPVFIKLVYLDEQGFLPKYDSDPSFAKFANLINKIMDFCDGKTPQSPEISEAYLKRLEEWTRKICRIHAVQE